MKYRRKRTDSIVKCKFAQSCIDNALFAQSYNSEMSSGTNSVEKQMSNISMSKDNLESFREEMRERRVDKVMNKKMKERSKYRDKKTPILPKSLRENIKNKKANEGMSPLI